MKITLKNFRPYKDSTFDFGDAGLSLLSGSSGAGKTSILLGFNFALFGTGTKLVMYGKSSCSVNVKINNMDITRTKRPNRLLLKYNENEYEDDAAQSIINKTFGESFKTTGYIPQNAKDSFIMKSPVDKLSFLEKFAFGNINLVDIKKRNKDLTLKRHKDLSTVVTKIEMAENMISEIKKPEKVIFPLKCNQKSRDKVIKNEIIRNKNSSIHIKRQTKKIYTLNEEYNTVKLLNATNKSTQELLDTNIKTLNNYISEKDNINYIGQDKLYKLKQDLKYIISKRDIISLDNRYKRDVERLEEMKNDADINRHQDISKLKESLWKDYTEEECKETISDYKQIIKDLEKVSELNTMLELYKVEDLDNDIKEFDIIKKSLVDKNTLLEKLIKQKELYKCPSCEVSLKLQDNKLCLAYDEDIICKDTHTTIDKLYNDISYIKKSIKIYDKTITNKNAKIMRYDDINKTIKDIESQYEDTLPVIDDIKSDLEYILDYYKQQKNNTKKIKTLTDNFTYHNSILSIQQDVDKQYTHIQKMKEVIEGTNFSDITYSEEELRDRINIQSRYNERMSEIDIYIQDITKKIECYKKQLSVSITEHNKKYTEVRNITDLNKIIETEEKHLVKLNEEKHLHQQNVELIEKYTEYKKSLDIYNSWVNKINKLKIEEKECKKLYTASEILKQKILEAESISMFNIISSINSHAQIYLESFFQDDPISIKLVSFKETKKGRNIQKKPQINLEIEYKGMEADINMLSGGELSRVILAYSLALGEMLNTPIMLLDECTSSLDQELTGVVMDGIREHFKDKLVVIIAHQVVKGQFDKVIKI